MRTTVRLDDSQLERAKREAERRGETLTTLIERGLRLVLANPEKRPRRRHVELPVCREGGGTSPGSISMTAPRVLLANALVPQGVPTCPGDRRG